MKYNYTVKFKFERDANHIYVMHFTIEATNNQEARMLGDQRWQDQVNKRERLQEAHIYKIICRKIETEPRQRKTNPLQSALAALNQYILENLSND